MPRLDAIKRDIQTVSELTEMTKVLEETAARDIAQMRERVLKSRPYFQEAWKINSVLQQLAPNKPNIVHKRLVVAITLDWGMTGSLLPRVLDKAEELYDNLESDLMITGKMGRDRFTNRDERTIHLFSIPKKAAYEDIEEVYKTVAKYAEIHIVYPRFDSLAEQTVTVASLIPQKDQKEAKEIKVSRFLIEPDPQTVVDYMNQVIVGFMMYSYFLEALLAYSAAQMVAMRAAADNAKQEKRILTIRYNKARREMIDSKLRELYETRFAGKGTGL